jgi:hypothetical protein
MNLKPHLALAALLAATGFSARAQQTPPPDAGDYPAFSRFISDRNIFDPSRRPRTVRTETPPPAPKPRPAVTPTFSLVGTMDYGKGVFAFFDGTSAGYRKSVQNDGEIAGYKVAEILPTGVTLVGTNSSRVVLKVGMQMRQEADDKWELSAQLAPIVVDETAQSSYTGSTSSRRSSSSSTRSSGTSSGDRPGGTPAEVNDVLKRLMELRDKEMK